MSRVESKEIRRRSKRRSGGTAAAEGRGSHPPQFNFQRGRRTGQCCWNRNPGHRSDGSPDSLLEPAVRSDRVYPAKRICPGRGIRVVADFFKMCPQQRPASDLARRSTTASFKASRWKRCDTPARSVIRSTRGGIRYRGGRWWRFRAFRHPGLLRHACFSWGHEV